MTNPIWVVKVRMFTTRADSPTSYRGLSGTLPFLSSLRFIKHTVSYQTALLQYGGKRVSLACGKGLVWLWLA
jgi:hypothetical protein